MDGNYDIFRGGEKIGKAQVKREGLYYRFRCVCSLTGDVIYRLTVTCGERTENLGILIPDGDVFRLEKKLSAGRFPTGEPIIQAVPGNPDRAGFFAPVKPDEPFRYLAGLQSARLARRGDEVGVLLEDQPAPLSSSNK